MKTPVLSLTQIYTQWLDSIKSMLPGGSPSPTRELSPKDKEEQAAAKQEWEDEGGSVKPPEPKPGAKPAPKMPL